MPALTAMRARRMGLVAETSFSDDELMEAIHASPPRVVKLGGGAKRVRKKNKKKRNPRTPPPTKRADKRSSAERRRRPTGHRPEWNSSVNNVDSMKATPKQLEERTLMYTSRNNALAKAKLERRGITPEKQEDFFRRYQTPNKAIRSYGPNDTSRSNADRSMLDQTIDSANEVGSASRRPWGWNGPPGSLPSARKPARPRTLVEESDALVDSSAKAVLQEVDHEEEIRRFIEPQAATQAAATEGTEQQDKRPLYCHEAYASSDSVAPGAPKVPEDEGAANATAAREIMRLEEALSKLCEQVERYERIVSHQGGSVPPLPPAFQQRGDIATLTWLEQRDKLIELSSSVLEMSAFLTNRFAANEIRMEALAARSAEAEVRNLELSKLLAESATDRVTPHTAALSDSTGDRLATSSASPTDGLTPMEAHLTLDVGASGGHGVPPSWIRGEGMEELRVGPIPPAPPTTMATERESASVQVSVAGRRTGGVLGALESRQDVTSLSAASSQLGERPNDVGFSTGNGNFGNITDNGAITSSDSFCDSMAVEADSAASQALPSRPQIHPRDLQPASPKPTTAPGIPPSAISAGGSPAPHPGASSSSSPAPATMTSSPPPRSAPLSALLFQRRVSQRLGDAVGVPPEHHSDGSSALAAARAAAARRRRSLAGTSPMDRGVRARRALRQGLNGGGINLFAAAPSPVRGGPLARAAGMAIKAGMVSIDSAAESAEAGAAAPILN